MTTRLGFRTLTHTLNRPPSKHLVFLRYNHHHDMKTPSIQSQPKILGSIESGFKSEPIQELPPDAKTQATIAFRQIGLVVRAIVYTGLGLGVTALIGFFGIHTWVEFLELPPPGRFNFQAGNDRSDQDFYGWNLELLGWGAGYRGKGTDSRIGWRARSIIRAAWVAQNWQSGQNALQVDDDWDQVASTSDHTTKLVDSAYLMSQSQLEEAISIIKQKKQFTQHPLNPTLLELENCLANISERINTHSSLKKAYQIYSKLSNSFIDSFNQHHHNENSNQDWKLYHAIKTIEKLFQVGLKIVDFERSKDQSKAKIIEKESERKLIWALNQVLGIQKNLQDDQPEQQLQIEPESHHSNWLSSTYNFFKNFNDQSATNDWPSSAVDLERMNYLETSLNTIHERLKQILSSPSLTTTKEKKEANESPISFSPIQLRLLISSLLKLSTHLVSINSFDKSLLIQNQIHDFLNFNIIENSNSKESSSSDKKLHEYWLKSRLELSKIYIFQIEHVLKNQNQKIDLNLQQQQILNSKKVINDLLCQLDLDSPNNNDSIFQKKWCRSFSGRLSENFNNLIVDLNLIQSLTS